jgi:hypothetical protein
MADGDYCGEYYPTVVTWPVAQGNCAALGQTLATIRSVAPYNLGNDMLYYDSLVGFGNCIWTGLSDRVSGHQTFCRLIIQ